LKTIKELVNRLSRLKETIFFNHSVNNPEFLVFFRVGVGLLLGLHFISILPDFGLLYGINSLIPSDIQIAYSNHQVIYYDQIVTFFGSILGSLDDGIMLFKISYIGLCLLIAIGFFSRFSSFLLLILQVGLMKSGTYFAYGVDFFSSMSLMYLILFPSDDHFSLRNLFWSIKRKSDLTTFRRVLQIHLSLAYFFSGFEKIIGYNWRNGESIWKAIHLPNFTNDFNINFDFLGQYPFLVVIIGWSAVIIEMCYPLFISLKKTRKLWLYLTISLHIGIALTLNLYFFSALMICWNITNFFFEDKKIHSYEVAY